jgi:uncharacterized protein
VKHSKAEPRLEEIPESECLEILGKYRLGRVAIVVDGRPQIFPVNYGLREKVVVFRTASGTKLAYAPATPVAFEIDHYDASEGAGWSVMVQGIARDATDSGDDFSWAARGAEAYPAAPGTKLHRVAIDPVTITGRRFGAKS